MKYRNQIKENSFAEACYNQNSIEELEEALLEIANGDLYTLESDCKIWNISIEEGKKQIELALNAKKEE